MNVFVGQRRDWTMVGLERGTVELVAYRDEWQEAFETEADRLREALDDRLVAVEHVGSTAVEGLAAKPILDVLAVVERLGDEERWTRRLEPLGYEFRPDDGVPDRLFYAKGPESNRTHYLSVTEQGSETHVEQVQFRDYLRDHPRTAAEYERLKRELADAYPDDRESYTSEKSAFVRKILRRTSEE